MATSKGTVVFFMATLLLCFLLVSAEDSLLGSAEDNKAFISYGSMGRDKVPKNEGYDGPPANEYNRGCEAIDRCRHD